MTSNQSIASSPDHSIWVNANAGSGKTKVLVDRIIKLLISKVEPSAILCITYTKAAAQEISQRIIDTLAGWLRYSDAELITHIQHNYHIEYVDLKWIRNLFSCSLQVSSKIVIQTIHSYCFNLLQQYPVEANIAVNASILDEQQSQNIATQIKYSLLVSNKPEVQKAITNVLRYLPLQAVDDLVSNILIKIHSFEYTADTYIKQLEQGLNIKHFSKQSIIDSIVTDEFFNELKMLMHLFVRGSNTNQRNATRIQEYLDDNNKDLELISDIFLTKDFKPRKSILNKKLRNESIDTLIAKITIIMSNAIDMINDLSNYHSSSDMVYIVDFIANEYRNFKKQQYLLDYQDIINHTNQLLDNKRHDSWVAYRVDNKISHILVDEAQDTSPSQWNIILTIMKEFFYEQTDKTIFVVGDAKQSIYSFQGADVINYNRVHGKITGLITQSKNSFQQIDMNTSYRSTSAVLTVVDQVFKQQDIKERISLLGCYHNHQVFRQHQHGKVVVFPLAEKGDYSNGMMKLAKDLAQQVKDWLEQGYRVKDSQVEPKDILILVRKRSNFTRYLEEEFSNQDIAVSGIHGNCFNENLIVMDLIAIAKFIILPEDDMNLAICLKSPLIDCQEDDIYQLCVARKQNSLWQNAG